MSAEKKEHLKTNLEHAIQEWERVLGADAVSRDGEELQALQRSTFDCEKTVLAALSPADTEEVQNCLKVAHDFKIPVYPVSRGKNWGLGSKVPPVENCVIVDLGKLNRITDYNEDFGYITVEPGVTFKQVDDFLYEKGSSFFLSVTSIPDGSVIANTLDSGHGRGPKAERINFACGFEVVLPTGKVIYTGMGQFPGATTAPLTKWSMGPSLDGLFVQSNFGIVTKMTLWLTALPQYFRRFNFKISDLQDLEKLVDAVRDIKLLLGLNIDITLLNDISFFCLRQRFPWDQCTEGYLTDQCRSELRQSYGLAQINGRGAIYSASRAIGLAEWKLIKKIIAPFVSELTSYDDRKLRWLNYIKPIYNWLTNNNLDLIEKEYSSSIFLGWTKTTAITEAYWRKRQMPSPPDPERDGCGVLSYFATLPLTGGTAKAMIDLYEMAMRKFRFELSYSFHFSQTGRILRTVVLLPYDRDVAGADAHAMACHDFIFHEALKLGVYPTRLGLQSNSWSPSTKGESKEILLSLKNLFDPNNILAPRRYVKD